MGKQVCQVINFSKLKAKGDMILDSLGAYPPKIKMQNIMLTKQSMNWGYCDAKTVENNTGRFRRMGVELD